MQIAFVFVCLYINLVLRALFLAGKIKRTGDEAYMFVRYKENEKYSVQLGKLYFLRVDKNRFCLFQYICNNYIKS